MDFKEPKRVLTLWYLICFSLVLCPEILNPVSKVNTSYLNECSRIYWRMFACESKYFKCNKSGNIFNPEKSPIV